MPTELFIKLYNDLVFAMDGNRYWIMRYLYRYFKVPIDMVERKIEEIKRSYREVKRQKLLKTKFSF